MTGDSGCSLSHGSLQGRLWWCCSVLIFLFISNHFELFCFFFGIYINWHLNLQAFPKQITQPRDLTCHEWDLFLRQKLMYGTCAKLGLQDLLDFQPSLAQAAWWLLCVFFNVQMLLDDYQELHRDIEYHKVMSCDSYWFMSGAHCTSGAWGCSKLSRGPS